MQKKLKAIVTSGPTRERIDPVRYISNDSSGKQGYAIADALAKNGVEVVLISGIVNIVAPDNVKLIKIETAHQMLAACEAELPADVAVFAAAVCDWRVENIAPNKLKKTDKTDNLTLNLIKNPDILANISSHTNRPKLVVGFAAETENLLENASCKLQKKGCDWIVANDVSQGVFGSDNNKITLLTKNSHEEWDKMSKEEVAARLVTKILSEIRND